MSCGCLSLRLCRLIFLSLAIFFALPSCVDDAPEDDAVVEYLAADPEADLENGSDFDPTDQAILDAWDGLDPGFSAAQRLFRWTSESAEGFGMVEFPAASGSRPLVVLFHGYGACHVSQQFYFQLYAISRRFNINLAAVNGEKNSYGKRFWNASEACCDVDGTNPNHKERLGRLIRDLKDKYDAPKVILWGHSNGGFLAYELACENGDLVDGVFSLAGSQVKGFECGRNKPLNVIHVHGTDDETVSYNEDHSVTLDGRVFAVHNSVAQSFETFSRQNGCQGEKEYVKRFGPFRYKTVIKEALGCEEGAINQTITIPRARHIPLFVPPSLWGYVLENLLEY